MIGHPFLHCLVPHINAGAVAWQLRLRRCAIELRSERKEDGACAKRENKGGRHCKAGRQGAGLLVIHMWYVANFDNELSYKL